MYPNKNKEQNLTSDFTDIAGLSGTNTTKHVGARQAGDGIVVCNHACARGSLVLGAHPEILPCGVGGYRRRSGKEDESGFHVCV